MAGLQSIDSYQKQNVKGLLLKVNANYTFDLEPWNIQGKATDKGNDGKNSLRSIYMWS